MWKIILLCILIFCLVPFVVISFYNFPSIDDFWNADKIIDYGRTGSVVYFYEHVSGRYFSLYLMSLLNGLPSGSFIIFRVWPVIIFLLLAVSIVYLLKQFFTNRLSYKQVWIAALVWLICSIVSSRSLYNVWYWVSSSICYQLGIAFTIFFAGAAIQWVRQQSFAAGFMATALAAIIPGCSELLIPLTTVIIIFFIYISMQKKLRVGVPVFWLIINLVAAYFSVSSEGAQVRAGNDHASVVFAVLQSLKSIGYYGFLWLINPVNFSALALLFFYLPVESIRFPISKHPWLWIFLSMLTLGLLVYMPVYWSGLKFPPPRITSIFFFIFSLGAILIIISFSNRLLAFKEKFKTTSLYKFFPLVCWLIFVVSVFFSKNFRDVATELSSGTAASYHRYSIERFRYIKQQESDTVRLAPLPSWSFVLSGAESEVKLQKAFKHYKTFFDKKEIILQGN